MSKILIEKMDDENFKVCLKSRNGKHMLVSEKCLTSVEKCHTAIEKLKELVEEDRNFNIESNEKLEKYFTIGDGNGIQMKSPVYNRIYDLRKGIKHIRKNLNKATIVFVEN